jgi:Kef-type K+ transport system membrane component KefB
MAYDWWLGPFGWGIFFIGLILAVILYLVRKKFYPVMYVVSIAMYIFTIGFVIDAFNLGKNSILLLLAISSIIFILVGVYFAKKFEKMKEKFAESIPVRRR